MIVCGLYVYYQFLAVLHLAKRDLYHWRVCSYVDLTICLFVVDIECDKMMHRGAKVTEQVGRK